MQNNESVNLKARNNYRLHVQEIVLGLCQKMNHAKPG